MDTKNKPLIFTFHMGMDSSDGLNTADPTIIVGASSFEAFATKFARIGKDVSSVGLVATFNDKKYIIPDISLQEFDQTIANTPASDNGLVKIDLTGIQTQNRKKSAGAAPA